MLKRNQIGDNAVYKNINNNKSISTPKLNTDLSPFLQDHGGVYVAYIGAFIIALFLFARALYYCTLSVSTIDGPM